MGLWVVVRFVHVVAAIFWVGGQLMLAAVVVPLLRREAPQLTRTLAAAAGRRFATITSFALFPLLVVTGALLAWHSGVRWSNLATTAYGRTLSLKVVAVGVTFALAAAHGMVARRLTRRAGRVLAVATLALSLLIVLLATTLASLPTP